ncbi:hypothetical protein Tco_1190292 [Tanacetum coccineum]
MKSKRWNSESGDKVMLKISPWKGVVRFGKRGKLNPMYVGPFKVLEKVGKELPEELSRVHNTFHVSNLKKYHADEPLAVDAKSDPIILMVDELKRGLEFLRGIVEDHSRSKVASDDLRDALSVIFGLSELKVSS